MKKPGIPAFLANHELQKCMDSRVYTYSRSVWGGLETQKANSSFWKTNKIFESKVLWGFNNKNRKCYSIFFAQNA